jgi:hypothetical protein
MAILLNNAKATISQMNEEIQAMLQVQLRKVQRIFYRHSLYTIS